MSRLEKALERASLRRGPTPAVCGAAVSPTVARSMDRLLDAPPLSVANPYLPTLQLNQNLVVNEAFRKLRSQVIRMTQGETVLNSLLVTSANAGEGKTISALNLAISLAQEYDYTVLLVDADLRKPSVHQYLKFKPEVGLIQCLKGEATLEQALIKTGLGKLVVLPAGGSVANPVELLSSSMMKAIIAELKQRYPERYVIIDSPPIGPFADAQVLSDAVDGVLFVVREGLTKLESVRDALGSLTENKLLGVIYNDCSNEPRHDRYNNYGAYDGGMS